MHEELLTETPKPCAVPGCVPKSWGHVGRFGYPHVPTELPPGTQRCDGTCARCKARPCLKTNGHEWDCECFFREKCVPPAEEAAPST